MKTPALKLLSLLCVLPLPAVAASSAVGEVAFQQACSRCHSARQTPNPENPRSVRNGGLKREAHAGPDLTAAYQKRGVEGIRTWVKDPSTNENHKDCDPRLLRASDVDNLVAFLQGRSAVEALPADLQSKKDLAALTSVKLHKARSLKPKQSPPSTPAYPKTSQEKSR